MAIRVDKNVGGFEVPMNDVCRVKILDALENLIHDELVVNVFEDLLSDGVVQVCLHILKDQIEVLVILRTDNIMQFNYVFMVQFVQIANFAICALGVDGVLEGVKNFFKRKCGVCFAVCDLPDVTVCP